VIFFDELEIPDKVTWNQHIRGLFTENNARCMISKGINLTSYENVRGLFPTIIERLTSSDPKKKMPPGDPWSEYQIKLFKKWGEGEVFLWGDTPSATVYATKIVDAPLRYQYPDTLPDDFIATFYQNIKPLFTNCDQKFGKEDYDVNVFNYKQLRDAAKGQGNEGKNIIRDVLNGDFPKGNPWPQTWKNVLNNWIKYEFRMGEVPIGDEIITVEDN